MDAQEMVLEIFQVLYERWVENVETPERFVGLQGDQIVVLQPAPYDHFAIVVIPANVGAPA